MKISIIMPVYNVERYLRQCLDSVLSQTVRDFELIAVDDGSMDSSPTILSEYAQKDPRIYVVKTTHSNAGKCRNVGMSYAKGEYLAFLDADDIFSARLLEVLLSGVIAHRADISCCAYAEFPDGEPIPKLYAAGQIEWHDCTPNNQAQPDYDIATACTWNKLYSRKYIEGSGLKYVEQPTTNDATFVWAAVANASKVIATDVCLVAYRRRKNSIQDKKSKYPECVIVANSRFAEEMVRLNVFERRPWVYEHYRRSKPSGYIDYLSTLRTRKSYMRAYGLIREELTNMWSPAALLATGNNRYTRRACRIITNSFKEKVQCNLEACLSSLLGQWNYSKGVKRSLIISIRRLILLVFDFVPTVKLIITKLSLQCHK